EPHCFDRGERLTAGRESANIGKKNRDDTLDTLQLLLVPHQLFCDLVSDMTPEGARDTILFPQSRDHGIKFVREEPEFVSSEGIHLHGEVSLSDPVSRSPHFL